jgi:DNA-binding transcriptional LysR family regulator
MDNPAILKATSQQLRAFEATARLLSVTRAAEELGLAQPTVSLQLRELAGHVGVPLFEQQGRRLHLTEAGEELQESVREVLSVWRRFDSRIAELKGVHRGTLRLAAVTTAEYLLPQLLGPFCEAYPGVEVQLAVENRATIIQRLDKSVDDLTVMMLPPVDERLRTLPFMESPLVVIAAKGHRLEGRKRLTLASLQEERWLLRENGSGGRQMVEAHFAREGFSPRIAMALGSNEAIKHAVAGGLGITVLSRHALGRNPAAQGLIELPVQGFPLPGEFCFVMREGRRLSPVAEAFLHFVREKLSRHSAH